MYSSVPARASVTAVLALTGAVSCGPEPGPDDHIPQHSPTARRPGVLRVRQDLAEPVPASSAAVPADSEVGTITGTVTLVGEPPVMRVHPRRREAEDACGPKDIVQNSVIVHDGKLKDALVRLAGDVPAPAWALAELPEKRLYLDRVNCVQIPRIQGAMVDVTGERAMTIEFRSFDRTLHNLHTYRGSESPWGFAEPRGAPNIVKEIHGTALYRFSCDVHPWEKAFLVPSAHPYFDVSAEDGRFTLKRVPPGTYEVEAWHSRYGWKRAGAVTVKEGESTTVDFEYSTKDGSPSENRDDEP